MRRTPVVLATTTLGMAGLLAFHSTPVHVVLPGLTTTTSPSGASGATGSTPPTTAGTGVRTAVGASENYYYGILSVQVTANGSQITNVKIDSLNDGGNPTSQYIDGQALPILIQEAMSAQNANIQSVSGASYTSAGFQASLQSALSKLGL